MEEKGRRNKRGRKGGGEEEGAPHFLLELLNKLGVVNFDDLHLWENGIHFLI